MKINRHNYETWFLDFAEGMLSSEEQTMVMKFIEENPDLKEEFELLDAELKLGHSGQTYDLKEASKKILPAIHADDELIIAYISGDLNPKEKARAAGRLEVDRSFKDLYNYYKLIYLQPDESVRTGMRLNVRGAVKDHLADYLIGFHEGDLSAIEQKLFQYHLKQNPKTNGELEVYSKLKLTPDPQLLYRDKVLLKKSNSVVIQMYRWTAMAAAAAVLLFFLLPALQQDQSLDGHENIALKLSTGIPNPPERLFSDDIAIIQDRNEKTGSDRVTYVPEKKIKVVPKANELIAPEMNTIVELEQQLEKNDKTELEARETKESVDIAEEGIALNQELHDQEQVADYSPSDRVLKKEPAQNNTFHILDAVEAAGEKSGLYTFTSNVNEQSDYKEFSLKLGKFKISRKAKKKSNS